MQTRQRILPFSMRLEPELKRMLQRWATEENRNLTNYVETVLRDHAEIKRAAEEARGTSKRAVAR